MTTLLLPVLLIVLHIYCVERATASSSWWRRHAGLDCTSSSVVINDIRNTSLLKCQAFCRSTPGCLAVATDVEKVEWAVHEDTNCYDGHGATELIDGSGTAQSCFAMSELQCRAQCLLTPRCEGVEWLASTGNCCLRGNITLEQCMKGSPWALHAITRRDAIPPDARQCRLLSNVTIGDCATYSDATDTYVREGDEVRPWWLSTNYAERSFMPRHFPCDRKTPNQTCTLRQLRALLPEVQREGYTVVNVDWPIEASPASLYEGFGAKDYWQVDPLLGSTEDWLSFVDEAHARGMRVVADFNPSYFWTGSSAFRRALADVRQYGVSRDSLPPDSPARWFRWNATCPASAPLQPPDADPKDGITNGWVRTRNASGACYWSIWGLGQPCGDLTSPEWRVELQAVLHHWTRGMKLDGLMLDAPPFYLAVPRDVTKNPLTGLHDDVISKAIREVIVEPLRRAGTAVFGETYNLLRPSYNKMLDGGRNTDMADGTVGFPSKLHDMVMAQDATGLETLLQETLDIMAGWSGGAVRTEPDNRGNATIAGQKAAVTALLGAYFVVRMGAPDCTSPLPTWHSPSGDEWPAGCFGKWIGADAVATTLRAVHSHSGLRPGTKRRRLKVVAGGPGAYAALRGDGDREGVVVVFNFASLPTVVNVDMAGSGVVPGQATVDLIGGTPGPSVPPAGAWAIPVGGHGWLALPVQLQT